MHDVCVRDQPSVLRERCTLRHHDEHLARVHELQLGTEEAGVLRGPAEQRRHAAEIDRRGNQRDAYRLSWLLGGECVRRQALNKAR